MKILLVDDDSEFVRECSELLFAHSWDVRAALTAEEARTILRTEDFDIVLVDLMLPPAWGREGLDLLRTIRESHSDSSILMMTQKSKGTTEVAADAMRLGAQYFLDKSSPVFYEKLISMIIETSAHARRRVFLSHGHSELLRLRLKDFLASRLKLEVMVLQELPSQGLTIVEKLERVSEKCCFAVILLTRDDEQSGGASRARQNVVHEIGFFQGRYGRQNVVLLAERGVELFSNISGIVRIEFEKDHFDEVFEPLRLEITESLGA